MWSGSKEALSTRAWLITSIITGICENTQLSGLAREWLWRHNRGEMEKPSGDRGLTRKSSRRVAVAAAVALLAVAGASYWYTHRGSSAQQAARPGFKLAPGF